MEGIHFSNVPGLFLVIATAVVALSQVRTTTMQMSGHETAQHPAETASAAAAGGGGGAAAAAAAAGGVGGAIIERRRIRRGNGAPPASVEMTAAVDGQVVLDCDLGASQLTSSDPVTWYHNGRPVNALITDGRDGGGGGGSRFRLLHFGRLEVSELRPSDSGRWVCQRSAGAAGGGQVATRALTLQVYAAPEPPFILLDENGGGGGSGGGGGGGGSGGQLRPVSQVTVDEHSLLHLVCVSRRSVPAARISWLLTQPAAAAAAAAAGHVTGQQQQRRVNVTGQSSSVVQPEQQQQPLYTTRSQLSVNVTRAMAGGRIVCVASHAQLQVYQEESVAVNVLYSPRFSVVRYPAFGHPIVRGMRVNLTCQADANPPVQPYWVKDNAKHEVSSGVGTASTGGTRGTLVFSPIATSDAGWYQCAARYANRTASSYSFLLNVIDDVESVQSTFKTVETGVGALMSISCDDAPHHLNQQQQQHPHSQSQQQQLATAAAAGDGGSRPRDSTPCWIRDSEQGRSVASRGSRIHFDGATYADTGVYSCEMPVISDAESTRRARARSFFVKVTGQPEISQLNVSQPVLMGLPATLTAVVCADPAPDHVIWTLGQRAVSRGQSIGDQLQASQLLDSGVNSCYQVALLVARVGDDAIGQATLTVTNQRGVDFRTVTVSPVRLASHVTATSNASTNHRPVCDLYLAFVLLSYWYFV